MRRSLIVFGVCALIASSSVAVALAGSGASIRILSAQPLVISGTHFTAHERLTIKATVGTEKAARQVTATRQGTFKVTLGQHFPAADPCGINGRIRVLRKSGRTLTHTLHFSQSSRGVACFMEGP
jgi:hypothetical protein